MPILADRRPLDQVNYARFHKGKNEKKQLLWNSVESLLSGFGVAAVNVNAPLLFMSSCTAFHNSSCQSAFEEEKRGERR